MVLVRGGPWTTKLLVCRVNVVVVAHMQVVGVDVACCERVAVQLQDVVA